MSYRNEDHRSDVHPLVLPFAALVGAVTRRLADVRDLKQYQQLKGLSDYQLDDIGLTRADVERLAGRDKW